MVVGEGRVDILPHATINIDVYVVVVDYYMLVRNILA
jgi:hypothetical protein